MNRNTKMILIAIIGVLAIYLFMLYTRGVQAASAHETKKCFSWNCGHHSPSPSSTPLASEEPSSTPSAEPSWSPSPSTTPDPTPCIQFVKEFPEPCPSETPLPTPKVTPEPTPGQGSSDVYNPSTGPADCTDVAPTRVPANFHMLRNGKLAQVKWLPDVNPEGNKVQLFWGVNGQGQTSSVVTDNDGFVEINLYDTQDYTFWAQVLNGCAAGPVTKAVVDGGTDHWVLFR